jgi:glycerol-3-phosphate O-acyltransferase
MIKVIEKPVISIKKTTIFSILSFDTQQALQLENASIDLAKMGGIQVSGVQFKAKQYAIEIAATFSNQQVENSTQIFKWGYCIIGI